jgi:hypothetical protein
LAAFSPDERKVKVMDDQRPQDGIILTPEQQRRRRARSIAIALSLGALVILFYVITIIKVGPHVLTRPM